MAALSIITPLQEDFFRWEKAERNREKQAGVLHTGSGPGPSLKRLPREVPIPGGEDRPVVREPAKIARFPLWLQAKRWGCHVSFMAASGDHWYSITCIVITGGCDEIP